MKKIIYFILVLFLIAYIAGCTSKPTTKTKADKTDEKVIENEISEVEKIDQDLNDQELDDLSKDLEDLNW